MDVDALLDSAGTSTKKSKNSTPTVEIGKALANKLNKWRGAKADKSTAEAKMKDIQEDVLPEIINLHKVEVEKAGKPLTTIKLLDADGNEFLVDVAKQQYKKISTDNEEALKERFGDDFDKLFTKERSVTLTKAALGDKELLTKLIKAVGQENFAKYFKVENVLVPTAKFHSARFVDVDNRVMEVIDEELVSPYAPALKG